MMGKPSASSFRGRNISPGGGGGQRVERGALMSYGRFEQQEEVKFEEK
jgi:hypothetical protein